MTLSSKYLGDQAEQLAARFLKSKGLTLITRNYHCRYGEIDLIMRDQESLVFVEVRYRHGDSYGGSVESVNQHKQRKVIKAAEDYLIRNRLYNNSYCRFDVVIFDKKIALEQLEWIQNVFY